MKRIFGIALVLAVLAVLSFGSVALAGDPIDVDITWGGGTVDAGGYPVDYGAGWVSGTVTAGNTLATTNFSTAGSSILGQFTAGYNVGGGPYGGNSYNTSMDAEVAGGGMIEFFTIRGALGYTGSGTLEPGGQQSYSYVYSSDGTASLANRTSTGATFKTHTGWDAGLLDNTYGWEGENFRVSGTSYEIIRQMIAGNGNYVEAWATGTGTAGLDTGAQQVSDSRTNQADLAYRSGYNFGWNQEFTATGTGQLILTAFGSNQAFMYDVSNTGADPGTSGGSWSGTLSVTSGSTYLAGQGLTATGDGTFGSAALQIITGFVSGTLNYPHASMTAK